MEVFNHSSKKGFLRRVVPYFKYNIIRDFRSCFSALGLHLCTNDRRLASFKNLHKGNRCFVLGNGPSLNTADLDRLQKETTFACNKIYLAFGETAWRPTYYAAEDNLVITQNYETINKLSGVTKFFPERTQKFAPRFDNALYFNMHLQDFQSLKQKFSSNALLWLYNGNTIVYTMIQLACFMGFSRIYLIGVDFSFSYSGDSVDGSVIKSDGEKNHFHPDYRKKGEKWNFPCLEDQEKAFTAARDAISKNDCRILDATRGGKLTVFPKVDLDEVLSPGMQKRTKNGIEN